MTETRAKYAADDTLARQYGLVVNDAGVVVDRCDPGEWHARRAELEARKERLWAVHDVARKAEDLAGTLCSDMLSEIQTILDEIGKLEGRT